MEFVDRFLKCTDCGNEFVFTAGEQLFFFDKQFKNDPKRCKLCKAKRAGLGRTADPPRPRRCRCLAHRNAHRVLRLRHRNHRPFKPTQGRPVLCRSCFQLKRVPAAVAAVATMDSPAAQIAPPLRPWTMPSGQRRTFARTTVKLIADAPSAVTADAGASAVSPR